MAKTSIPIGRDVRDKLRAEKQGGETYTQVIERLLDDQPKQLTDYTEFVANNAVSDDYAVSYVHFGLDDAYHPTGGYWFPTGELWGDSSGWVKSKDSIPDGELIRYPCDDKQPEIKGLDGLPEWVEVNNE